MIAILYLAAIVTMTSNSSYRLRTTCASEQEEKVYADEERRILFPVNHNCSVTVTSLEVWTDWLQHLHTQLAIIGDASTMSIQGSLKFPDSTTGPFLLTNLAQIATQVAAPRPWLVRPTFRFYAARLKLFEWVTGLLFWFLFERPQPLVRNTRSRVVWILILQRMNLRERLAFLQDKVQPLLRAHTRVAPQQKWQHHHHSHPPYRR